MAPQLLSIWHTVKRGSRYRTKMKKKTCVSESPQTVSHFLNDCFCMFLFVLQKKHVAASGWCWWRKHLHFTKECGLYGLCQDSTDWTSSTRGGTKEKQSQTGAEKDDVWCHFSTFCQGKDLTFFTTCVRFYVSSRLLLRLLHLLLASTADYLSPVFPDLNRDHLKIFFTDIKPTK